MKWLTLAIAAYGAVVATVEAITRWRERRRGRASLVSVSTHWWEGADGKDRVEIEIHNLSPEAIRIDRYGWFSEGLRTPLPEHPMNSFHSGLRIEPRDGDVIETRMRELEISPLHPERRLVSWVRLTTGEEFTAPPIPVPEDSPLRLEVHIEPPRPDRIAPSNEASNERGNIDDEDDVLGVTLSRRTSTGLDEPEHHGPHEPG